MERQILADQLFVAKYPGARGSSLKAISCR